LQGSFRAGRVFGIDVEINVSWLLVFALFSFTLAQHYYPMFAPEFSPTVYWSMGIISTILIFVSILLHELGHSLVAIREGISIKKITLFIFGGVAHMEEEPKSPAGELKIALFGPGVSIVLGFIFLAFYYLTTPEIALNHVLRFLAQVNFVVGIINLIPAFPLDGGRVLRAGLWHIMKSMIRATRAAAFVGSVFAFLAIGIGFVMIFQTSWWGLWYIFLGWMLYQAGQSSYVQLVFHQALKGVPVSQIMSTEVQTVSPNVTLDRLVEKFYKYRFGAFPVADNGRLRGLVDFNQVRGVPSEEWPNTPVSRIMIPEEKLVKVAPNTEAVEAMMKMAAGNVGRILVVEGGELMGILSRTDMMKLIRMHMLLEKRK